MKPKLSPILEHLDALEGALVSAGFPAMSSWWRSTLAEFYGTRRRQLVLRVGRRGGKSSTLCRVAVLEALYGDHKIPPGDVGIVGIVSVTRDEAGQRLRTIRAILDTLHVPYTPTAESITLANKPIVFKVFACTSASVVGGTWVCAIADEVARWRDEKSGANPATEVLGALRPTMATQKTARIFLSSSPLGNLDAHAVAFDVGTSAFQQVSFAETWVAHPAISESDSHGLESNPHIWAREYAARPQAGERAVFSPEDVARAFEPRLTRHHETIARAVVMDQSSGKIDRWTYALVERIHDAGRELTVFSKIGAFDAKDFRTGDLTGAKAVEKIAAFAKANGCNTVHGDQRESMLMKDLFASNGVEFKEHVWTGPAKIDAVAKVARWFTDGTILIAPHDTFRRELLIFEERITASGSFTYQARTGHDDFVSLCVTSALADLEGGLTPPRSLGGVSPRPDVYASAEHRTAALTASLESRRYGGDADGSTSAFNTAARNFLNKG